MMQSLIILLLAFILSVIISPLIIKLMKRLKAGQPILGYVDKHYDKSGCPTMGGLIFVLPVIILTLICSDKGITLGKYSVYIVFSYALVGFLDDFIKVKFKENKGLRAYQKIIAQLAIAIIIAIFAYNSPYIPKDIALPFTERTLNLGIYYIPFVILIFLATTNAVNLTDGLDGLAASTSLIYFIAFLLIVFTGYLQANFYGDVLLSKEYQSLLIFLSAFIGSLLAFLWFNTNPAQIFMGDTGSLAIGGGVASVAVFSNNPFLIVIIGIMFVISCISVIVQVLYFKATKGKRIFLMAPLHHHLEYKGIKEWKIVAYYSIITFLMAIVGIISIS